MLNRLLFKCLIVPISAAAIILSCSNPQPLTSGDTNPASGHPDIDSLAQISEYIVSAFEDNKGNLWFGTMSDGVVKFDGKSFTYISTKDGLINNTVTGIIQDTA